VGSLRRSGSVCDLGGLSPRRVERALEGFYLLEGRVGCVFRVCSLPGSLALGRLCYSARLALFGEGLGCLCYLTGCFCSRTRQGLSDRFGICQHAGRVFYLGDEFGHGLEMGTGNPGESLEDEPQARLGEFGGRSESHTGAGALAFALALAPRAGPLGTVLVLAHPATGGRPGPERSRHATGARWR